LIADYYVIRKRKINVDLFYDEKGVYQYNNGFSYAGMIALVVGAAIAISFLKLAWILGFPVSAVVYIILKRSGIDRKFEQQEVEYAKTNPAPSSENL
jgi:NCS1 family nucleobase:cation symporter-1